MTKAKLSGLEVLASGSIVVLSSQQAVLYPFDDDPLFRITIDTRFSEDDDLEAKTFRVKGDGDRGVILEIARKFRSGMHFSNSTPIIFASDDEGNVCINLALNAFGKVARYTTVANYTIYRQE